MIRLEATYCPKTHLRVRARRRNIARPKASPTCTRTFHPPHPTIAHGDNGNRLPRNLSRHADRRLARLEGPQANDSTHRALAMSSQPSGSHSTRPKPRFYVSMSLPTASGGQRSYLYNSSQARTHSRHVLALLPFRDVQGHWRSPIPRSEVPFECWQVDSSLTFTVV